eukprot:jgi/Mesen1/3270/ME000019S02690
MPVGSHTAASLGVLLEAGGWSWEPGAGGVSKQVSGRAGGQADVRLAGARRGGRCPMELKPT